jgi:hypothetical protein
MNKYLSLTLALAVLFSAEAFTSTANVSTRQSSDPMTPPLMAVVDINEEGAFDNTIKNAAGSLVVVDYSTTW